MGLRSPLTLFIVFILIILIFSLGCISSDSVEDVIKYWSSIHSFEAVELVIIGDQTFESHVNFTKPDKIARADYMDGSLVQKVVIENNTQKVITANGTFFLNATLDDVNALDPFVAILNNLNSFNVTREGDILLLKPKIEGMPVYEVELNGKLPRRITIKQAGLTIVVEYKTIEVAK